MLCYCGNEFTKPYPQSRKTVCSEACYNRKWKQDHKERARDNKRRYRQRRRLDPRQKEKDNARTTRNARKRLQTIQLLKMASAITKLDKATEGNMSQVNDVADSRKKLQGWSVDQLKSDLASGLSIIRDRLLHLAAIVVELDSRNVAVDGDPGLLKILRRVADGSLLVDAIVRFASTPRLMGKIVSMPVPRQQEMIDKEDVEVRKTLLKPKKKPAMGGCHGPKSGPDISGMIANGSPGDVAELIIAAIRSNARAWEIAEKLIPELQSIKGTRPRQVA